MSSQVGSMMPYPGLCLRGGLQIHVQYKGLEKTRKQDNSREMSNKRESGVQLVCKAKPSEL